MDQIIWKLVGKKIAGEATLEELAELQRLLRESDALAERIRLIENYWHLWEGKTEYEERETALEKHLLRLRAEGVWPAEEWKQPVLLRKPRRLRLRLAFAAAACVVIAVGIVALLHMQERRQMESKYKTLYVSKGSRNHFLLPDGSKVWLNAGTELRYPRTLGRDSIREVFLSGEAFFEIGHDDARPFWIRTKQMDILDIGTEFNVKAYPSDETAEATLITGSIEVKIKDINHTQVLSVPHEKITVYKRQGKKEEISENCKECPSLSDPVMIPEQEPRRFEISKVIPQPVDSLIIETAWMKDALAFRNQSFKELAVLLERWYDVTISFEDQSPMYYRFTGKFADETIEQALGQLKLIRKFEYNIVNGSITIRE